MSHHLIDDYNFIKWGKIDEFFEENMLFGVSGPDFQTEINK